MDTDVGQFAIVPSWLLDSDISSNAIKLFAVLHTYANGENEAHPGRKELARRLGKKAPVSLDTVDAAKAELVKVGALVVVPHPRRDGKPGQGANEYRLMLADPSRRGSAQPQEIGPPQPILSGPELDPDRTKEVPSALRQRVQLAWLAAPGMMQHRPSYFGDDKVRRAIDRAVKKYGVEDVERAIGAYAEVVASPAHYFKHRWTCLDFLNRGLDKFVPEAEPLKVYVARPVMVGVSSGEHRPGQGMAGDMSRFDR